MLIVAPGCSARADGLEALLRQDGLATARTEPGTRSIGRTGPDAVVTVGGHAAAVGRKLRIRGVPWIADLGPADPIGPELRAASAVTSVDGRVLQAAHEARALALTSADGAPPIVALLRAAVRPRGERIRVLQLGPVNTSHVEHMALALRDRGADVVVAGEVWPGLPPSVLPAAAIPTELVDGAFVPWLRRAVRRVRPDIVHAHWTPFAAKALVAHARPLVVQPWGSDVYRASAVFRAANVPVARLADRIVCDSADLVAAMVRLGARPERTLQINWGVNLDSFSPTSASRQVVRRRLGLEDGPLVLSPRSLKPLYNPRTIVAAFEQVRARIPGAQLALKHMATQAPPELGSLPDGVRVVGHVPYAEMADWYRAADVCVSIPDTDSSPRSVWESMACGTPCVVSDLPWAHEELRPGQDVMMVAVQATAVADAVIALLEDDGLAGRLAANGRAMVERTRDRDREMERLVELYCELAGR